MNAVEKLSEIGVTFNGTQYENMRCGRIEMGLRNFSYLSGEVRVYVTDKRIEYELRYRGNNGQELHSFLEGLENLEKDGYEIRGTITKSSLNSGRR